MKLISYLHILWISLLFTFTSALAHPTPTVTTVRLATSNTLLYVNRNVQGGNASGDSWANAIPELADAIETAINNTNITEIWVAAGTYYPLYLGDGQFESNNIYSRIFNITNLKLYGGFSGNETSREARNWKDNPTIISGNIGNQELNTDNLSELIVSNGANKETILDGFIVEEANGTESTIQFSNSTARHIINHCIIRNNRAMFGALQLTGLSNSIIANSLFLRNNGYQVGGLMNNYGVSSQVINTNFIGNSGQNGGAVENYGQLTIVNSIFWNNRSNASTTHDIYTTGGSTVANSITQVYGNSPDQTVINSFVGITPWFNDSYNDDYSLWSSSQAINNGNNSLYDSSILGTRDLNGVERIRNTTIDMGAYEVQNGDNPLPLRLINFSSQTESQYATLTWQTADEFNTAFFEIERSLDGKNFSTAGIINANTLGNHSYTYTDSKPISGLTYYRLRMVDQDGSYSYSKIIAVQYTETTALITAYPNPVITGSTIILEASTNTTVTLQDITGRIIQNYIIETGNNSIQLPIIPPGLYLITTKTGQQIRIIINQ